MRVLIAGITGYLGRHVCAELVKGGHEVVGTSRDPSRANVAGAAHIFRWSPVTEHLPSEALQGADAIVYLVGESVFGRWTDARKRRIHASRVEGVWNIVRGIEASDHVPNVLVSGSAVGYYGDRGDDELTESEPPGTDFQARLTVDWERAALEAERLGMRAVMTRTGLVVGSGAMFLRPQLPLFKLGLGGRLGSGNQWWSWVHVDDVARFIRFALEHDNVRGPVNVVSPNPVRQRHFAKTLGRAVHRPVFTWAPAWAIRLVLGEMSGEVLTSKRVRPTAAQTAGYTFAYPDLLPALRNAVSKE